MAGTRFLMVSPWGDYENGILMVNDLNIWLMILISGWWYTYPSEKYESVGMMTLPIYGKIKFMFQTTNQI